MAREFDGNVNLICADQLGELFIRDHVLVAKCVTERGQAFGRGIRRGIGVIGKEFKLAAIMELKEWFNEVSTRVAFEVRRNDPDAELRFAFARSLRNGWMTVRPEAGHQGSVSAVSIKKLLKTYARVVVQSVAQDIVRRGVIGEVLAELNEGIHGGFDLATIDIGIGQSHSQREGIGMMSKTRKATFFGFQKATRFGQGQGGDFIRLVMGRVEGEGFVRRDEGLFGLVIRRVCPGKIHPKLG